MYKFNKQKAFEKFGPTDSLTIVEEIVSRADEKQLDTYDHRGVKTMKIYREYLNEIAKIDIPENIYENTLIFKKYESAISNKADYLFGNNLPLKANFKSVIIQYCKPNKSYILHKFKGYYAISLLCDMWTPEEVSNEIKVFDEKQIYPLQTIKISIDWDY